MVKGGKRYSSMSNDGKWFAHSDLSDAERRNRRTCTSTGIMLSQVKSSLPQALKFERHPKTQQKSKEYKFSEHDNKHSLKDNISVFSHGVGRRKCLDHRRQHNSHFCLSHAGAAGGPQDTGRNVSAYRADFTEKQAAAAPAGDDGVPAVCSRRFPRDHRRRSAEAAAARAGERFMWFGRNDLRELTPPELTPPTGDSASLSSRDTPAITA